MVEKNKKPELRFKGFTDVLERKKLGDLCQIGDIDHRMPQSVIDGIPYLMTGDFVGINELDFENSKKISTEDYEQLSKKIKPEKGDILFARYASVGAVRYIKTQSKFLVSYSCAIIKHSNNANGKYLYYYLQANQIQRQIELEINTGSQRNIGIDSLKKLIILLPQEKEQEEVAIFLTNLDQLITLNQLKYNKLVTIKKAMLGKMFPKEGTVVPEIRFKGFTDNWEQRKLGDLMNVTSVKRIHQSDWTNSGIRFLRARDIVSASKNEEPADYLYISEEKYVEYSAISGKVQKGDLLVTGVGTIGVTMLISSDDPLYFKDGNIIWFKNENTINGLFLYYSFNCAEIQGFIKDSAGIGTVGTYTIYSGKKTPIMLPNKKEEQSKIGNFFKSYDNLITLRKRELEKLKNIKKAYLEKMFV